MAGRPGFARGRLHAVCYTEFMDKDMGTTSFTKKTLGLETVEPDRCGRRSVRAGPAIKITYRTDIARVPGEKRCDLNALPRIAYAKMALAALPQDNRALVDFGTEGGREALGSQSSCKLVIDPGFGRASAIVRRTGRSLQPD